MKYEPVIGLEVHCQLKTKSKLFCGCSTEFGRPPNSLVCPVCLGIPGVLPVLNKKAVELSVRTGLALNCKISSFSKFDRKNYFYPDLPKAYQVSQFDLPINEKGELPIQVGREEIEIGITRAHLEEDAGKLLHAEGGGDSSVDYNRTGVPLLEIVSEPDLRTPEEAYEYLKALKAILQYLEVSDCNMEQGSLRCDANISIRPVGTKEFGTRTEIKNLNSFRNVQKAIQYEIERQTKCLDAGERIVQETLLWDAVTNKTRSMRSKEEAHDYRYFPEPDLVPVVVDPKWIEEIRGGLPELPAAKRARFIKEFEIPEYDAQVLTSEKSLADYFETCVRQYPNSKVVSNWITSELLSKLNKTDSPIDSCKIQPLMLVEMLKLIDNGTISGKIAKQVFSEMYESGEAPEQIVKEKGLTQIADTNELDLIISKVLSDNSKSVADYQSGKKNAFGFLVGQVMKATKGKANPKLVNEILATQLK